MHLMMATRYSKTWTFGLMYYNYSWVEFFTQVQSAHGEKIPLINSCHIPFMFFETTVKKQTSVIAATGEADLEFHTKMHGEVQLCYTFASSASTLKIRAHNWISYVKIWSLDTLTKWSHGYKDDCRERGEKRKTTERVESELDRLHKERATQFYNSGCKPKRGCVGGMSIHQNFRRLLVGWVLTI